MVTGCLVVKIGITSLLSLTCCFIFKGQFFSIETKTSMAANALWLYKVNSYSGVKLRSLWRNVIYTNISDHPEYKTSSNLHFACDASKLIDSVKEIYSICERKLHNGR